MFLAERYLQTNEISNNNSYADMRSHLGEPDLRFHRNLGLKQVKLSRNYRDFSPTLQAIKNNLGYLGLNQTRLTNS